MKPNTVFFFFTAAFYAVIFGLFSAAATAETASDWTRTDMVDSRLVSAGSDLTEEGQILLGFELKLKDGWKTYWRNPGDSGVPPRFNWQGSENIDRIQVKWPTPMAFDSLGFLTWGYEKEVIFPIVVTLKEMSKPTIAQLQINYGVCADVCIPLTQDFRLEITAADAKINDFRDLVGKHLSRTPVSAGNSDYIDEIQMTVTAAQKLQLDVTVTEKFTNPVLILEGEDGDFFNVQAVSISANHQEARFEIDADVVRKNSKLSGRVLFATIFDEGWAVETVVTIK